MNEEPADAEKRTETDEAPLAEPPPPAAPRIPTPLPARQSRSRAIALAAAGAVVALAFGGYQFWRHPGFGKGGAAKSAMPASTFLAVSLDMKLLRSAEWFRRLADNDAGRLVGLANLKQLCGYDATAFVDEIDVAIPEKGDHGDFGVVMQALDHPLDDKALVECAKKLATLHTPATPGRAAEPDVHERSGFSILQQDGVARFAMRPGGPYLTGRGTWLDAMVDSASGAAPSIDTNPEHTSLRAAARKALPDSSPAAVVASTLLPPDVRAQVRAEMAGETDEKSAAAMDGVLGVSGVGLALGTRGPQPRLPDGGADLTAELVDVALELHCASAQACTEVAALIERKRDAFSGDFRVRMLGLETAVDSIVAAAEGSAVHVSLHFNPERVVKALGRFGFGGRGPAPGGGGPGGGMLGGGGTRPPLGAGTLGSNPPGGASPGAAAPPPSAHPAPPAAGGGGFAGDYVNPSPFGAPAAPPPASPSARPLR